MATLICSQGHANPVGQRYCGECGEDLSLPSPATAADQPDQPDQPDQAVDTADQPDAPEQPDAPTEAAPRYSTPARVVLGILALVIVATLIALVVLLVDRRSSTPTGPSSPATTVARGDQVGVVYFPGDTDETTLVARVAAECADHPEFSAVEVHLIDLDTGNFDTGQAHTYPCT